MQRGCWEDCQAFVVPASETVQVSRQCHASKICAQSPLLAQLDVSRHHTHSQATEAHNIHIVGVWEQEGLQAVQRASACAVQEA